MLVYSTSHGLIAKELTLEELTLKHFNGVVGKTTTEVNPYVSQNGFIIPPNAIWAKDTITAYYKSKKGSAADINKTFHKSWNKVLSGNEAVLLIEQWLHYATGYGTDFTQDVFIPQEELNLPIDLTFKVVKVLAPAELAASIEETFKSGIALAQETIEDLLKIYAELGYEFTADSAINNKEAEVIVAAKYGFLPKDVSQFMRMLVYKTTGNTLVIKNRSTIEAIKNSNWRVVKDLEAFGYENLAPVFNRYKPIFLAFKGQRSANKAINYIAKLSKSLHKPMVQNPMNELTSATIPSIPSNVTTPALLRALNMLTKRLGGQDTFNYKVRNGKSFVKENKSRLAACYKTVMSINRETIIEELSKRINFKGQSFYIPSNVKYGVPTSEKQMVGNLPNGTQISADRLAVGIYWENSWGARDLDLSAVDSNGEHVGWNGSRVKDELAHSGDITDAPEGAVEYLYAGKNMTIPHIVRNNVYSGSATTRFNIIVGEGDEVTNDYMMNPNNVILQAEATTTTAQQTLGVLLPQEDKQTFILAYDGSGNRQVTGRGEVTQLSLKALMQEAEYGLTFNTLIEELGGTIVTNKDEADHDLSLDNLTTTTFISLLA